MKAVVDAVRLSVVFRSAINLATLAMVVRLVVVVEFVVVTFTQIRLPPIFPVNAPGRSLK